MRTHSVTLLDRPTTEPRRSLTIFFSSAFVNLKTVPSSSKRRPVSGGGGEGGGGEGGGEGGFRGGSEGGEGGVEGGGDKGGALGGGGPCGGSGGIEGMTMRFARVSVSRS